MKMECPLTGKRILTPQLPVNGTIHGEISSQVHRLDVTDATDVVGVSSLPD
jgi:hypothetical protein